MSRATRHGWRRVSHAIAACPCCWWLTHATAEQEHIDYYSLQALLYKEQGLSFFQQTKLFFAHTKRQQK
jgi:hypothetical protein